MSTTRSVRPTDLVALVSLDGRVYLNEARTWDQLGRRPEGPRLLDSALVPWFSFATGRHTWISVQGQSIRGLVSARQRGNRTAWEIDCLIAATDEEQALSSLLDQVSAEAGQAGVLRIFLRLEAASELISPVRRAGFIPVSAETLFRSDGPIPAATVPDELSMRPYEAADAFGLFRLHNAAVPEPVRRVESPTFQHWVASSERRSIGRAKQNLVVRRGGDVVAHLRACRESRLAKVDLVVHPSAHPYLPALIQLVCSYPDALRPLFCLAPSYAEPLGNALEAAGFRTDSEYTVLVKRTALPLSAGKTATVRGAALNPAAAG